MTNTKTNWGLIIKSFLVYFVVTILLVNLIGTVVGAIAFIFFDKNKEKSTNDLWIYSGIVGVYTFIKGMVALSVTGLPVTRSFMVTFISSFLTILLTYGISWLVIRAFGKHLTLVTGVSHIEIVKKYLDQDEELKAYVFAQSPMSIGLTAAIGAFSVFALKFYYIVLTDKRILLIRVSTKFEPLESVSVGFDEIQQAGFTKNLFSNTLLLLIKDKPSVVFTLPNLAGGLPEQSANIGLLASFVEKYPSDKKAKRPLTVRDIAIMFIVAVVCLFASRVLKIGEFVHPVLAFIGLPILVSVLNFIFIKRDYRKIGLLSGVVCALVVSLSMFQSRVYGNDSSTLSYILTTFATLVFFYAAAGYLTGFVAAILTGSDKYKDYLG